MHLLHLTSLPCVTLQEGGISQSVSDSISQGISDEISQSFNGSTSQIVCGSGFWAQAFGHVLAGTALGVRLVLSFSSLCAVVLLQVLLNSRKAGVSCPYSCSRS